MKNLFKALVLLMALAPTYIYSQSCCSAGAGCNWNILPNINRHVVGLRYLYGNYYSVNPESLIPEKTGEKATEQMHSAELFMRFNVWQRLQLAGILPVMSITRESAGVSSRFTGLGDASILLQYGVLNPAMCEGRRDKHQLRLGIGVKLPTGKFRMNEQMMFLSNLQCGTGSTDILWQSMYTFRMSSTGFNAGLNAKLNTPNKQAYRYGHLLQAQLQWFYLIEKGKWTIMPSAGMMYQHVFQSARSGKILGYTGSDQIQLTAGLDFYLGAFALSINAFPAVYHHLNWDGELRNRVRAEAGVYYNFAIPSRSKQIKKN